MAEFFRLVEGDGGSVQTLLKSIHTGAAAKDVHHQQGADKMDDKSAGHSPGHGFISRWSDDKQAGRP